MILSELLKKISSPNTQGRTADRAIIHVDTEERNLIGYETFYVGLSRARDAAQIFTDDVSKLPAVLRRSLEKESALEAVRTHAADRSRVDRER